jgi:hypothetical protein
MRCPGEIIGQAAVFDRYEDARGKEVVVQGYEEATAAAMAAAAAALPPSEEELAAAAAGVQQWAEYVRNLKEVQGLTNKVCGVRLGRVIEWLQQGGSHMPLCSGLRLVYLGCAHASGSACNCVDRVPIMQDPAVQEAVGNLNAWKAQQAALQKRLDDALAAAKAAFDDEDEEE